MSKPKPLAESRRGKAKTTRAGRKILAGLEEAAAHMRGDHVPGIVVHKSSSLANRRKKQFDKEGFRAILKREGGEAPPPDDNAPRRKGR